MNLEITSQSVGKRYVLISLVTGGSIFLASCSFLPSEQVKLKLRKEYLAIQTLSGVCFAEAQYNAIYGKFGTLQELASAGLIDQKWANGEAIQNYVYASSRVGADTYCVQATRIDGAASYRDFNVIEDATIRARESATPLAIPCGEGLPLTARQ